MFTVQERLPVTRHVDAMLPVVHFSKARKLLGTEMGENRRQKKISYAVRCRVMTSQAFVGPSSLNKEAFPQPLEYASLLGLQGSLQNLQETRIIAAFEDLSNSNLEKGYSKHVEEGREALLHAAVDGVRRLRSLGQRSERHGYLLQEHTHASIQWSLLPAALSLLQETGQADLVLELGSLAVNRREAAQHKRDILLTMALAHCDLSATAFDGRDQVGLGCAHLEEALALLEKAGFVPGMSKLASEIQDGLRELKPHCVIEHLKLPITTDNQKKRKQAISVLKSLLANPDLAAKGDGSTGVDKKFVRDSLILLTSTETVNLLDWNDIAENGSTIPWYFDGLVERGGIAQIVAGFCQRRPALIEQGANLLNKRQNVDLLIEQVVCHVLLANTSAATFLLLESEKRGYFKREATLAGALRENNTSSTSGTGNLPEPSENEMPAKGEALTFIRAHSPDGDYDLLPGLCAFTDKWLTNVAFPRFQDTSDSQISASLTDYYENEMVTSHIAVRGKEDSLRAGVLVISDKLSNKLQQIRDAPLSTRNAKAHKRTTLPKLELPEGLGGLQQSSKQSQLLQKVRSLLPRPKQVLFAAIGISAVLLAVSGYKRYAASRPTMPSTSQSTESTTASSWRRLWQIRAPWQSSSGAPVLRKRAAESCIRKWLKAKALAMGPRHDESQLAETVSEPYLSTVRKDAASTRKAGWFWSYRLSDVYIESVDNSKLEGDRSGEALVTARLREKGELFAVSGKRSDQHCYDNSYRAEYRMTLGSDRVWKVSNVLVLGEES